MKKTNLLQLCVTPNPYQITKLLSFSADAIPLGIKSTTFLGIKLTVLLLSKALPKQAVFYNKLHSITSYCPFPIINIQRTNWSSTEP